MQNITQSHQGIAPSGDMSAFTASPSRPITASRVRLEDAKTKQGLLARCWQFIKQLLVGKKKEVLAVQAPAPAPALHNTAAVVAQLVQVEKPVFKVTTSTLVSPLGNYAGKPTHNYTKQLAEKEFLLMDTTQVARH